MVNKVPLEQGMVIKILPPNPKGQKASAGLGQNINNKIINPSSNKEKRFLCFRLNITLIIAHLQYYSTLTIKYIQLMTG